MQFSPAVKGHAIRGGDHITIDPSGEVLRLNLDTLIETCDKPPEYIRIQATGAEIATQDVMALVTGSRTVKPIKWGDFQATSSWTFSTGSTKYWSLQNAVYVGSTSLRVGPQTGTFIVGFKIEKVVSQKTELSV